MKARTGFPFIDAIMTQLRREGWIHHLARHAVACFLTRGDLWISWEEGKKVCTSLLKEPLFCLCVCVRVRVRACARLFACISFLEGSISLLCTLSCMFIVYYLSLCWVFISGHLGYLAYIMQKWMVFYSGSLCALC